MKSISTKSIFGVNAAVFNGSRFLITPFPAVRTAGYKNNVVFDDSMKKKFKNVATATFDL